MAELTAIEIQQQTFREVFRGYDRYEIEQFLEDVVKTMRAKEALVRQQMDRISELEADLSATDEAEEAIKRTFVAAQRTSQEMVAEAQEKANQLMQQAQAEADSLRRQASEESERMLTSSIEEAERVKREADEVAKNARSKLEHEYGDLRAQREAEQHRLAQRLVQLRTAVGDLQERVKAFAITSSGELEGIVGSIDLETHSIADILERADQKKLDNIDEPDTEELMALEEQMEHEREGDLDDVEDVVSPNAVYLQQPRGLRPWERHRGYRGGVR
ncbi:MAG: DivIVA domain-containing protein [Acidimicrobiia bacterium]|nr:DivIVA domain-containing protein [Acidimicrobiia bacterium]MBT8250857.1 DivIVA domain-containing protein [Acidimicrobiia bacterium]NNC42743.1 DivIVA domain-containing protein [Acidimicrobiia bacterium]NND12337.1 DivIVA domain-containing protein [Acidimicrobiia bacterium]NNL29020.1 DivIVA domain-containing protein [Acidimicrobiia bacterium]